MTKSTNNCQSPYKYGTPEWREWARQKEAAEIAARPTGRLVRRKLATFEDFRKVAEEAILHEKTKA
jgi:hypothetical protein